MTKGGKRMNETVNMGINPTLVVNQAEKGEPTHVGEGLMRKAFRNFAPIHYIKGMGKSQDMIAKNLRKSFPGLSDDVVAVWTWDIYMGAKRLTNLYDIVDTASTHLIEAGNAEPDWDAIQDDFLHTFVDQAGCVSDEYMKDIWARILASEVNAPGSNSKHLLSILSSMDKGDAEQFLKVCSANVVSPGIPGVRQLFIYSLNDPYYGSIGVSLSPIIDLEGLGLLKYFAPPGYYVPGLENFQGYNPWKGLLLIAVGGKDLYVRQDEGQKFPAGQVQLTGAGKQLFSICDVKTAPGFDSYLIKTWNSMGLPVFERVMADGEEQFIEVSE
jgi:hypothetical protein